MVVDLHPADREGRSEDIAAAIARGAGAVPAEKPVLVVFMARGGAPAPLASGPRGRLPVYDVPENAARALAAAERYARWRARPTGTVLELDPFAEQRDPRGRRSRAGRRRRPALARRRTMPRRSCAPPASRSPSAKRWRRPTRSAAAERLGYPLVAKAVAPGLVHRSDRGGVQLDLHSARGGRRRR